MDVIDEVIYGMKLNQTEQVDKDVWVRRVPGGWLYETCVETGTGGYSLSTCFVPYDNEFDARNLAIGGGPAFNR